MNKLPLEVVENIFNGSAIAFLGSGFSSKAKLSGKTAPCGNAAEVPSSDAAKELLAKSVGYTGNLKDVSLSDVAELVREMKGEGASYNNYMTSFFLTNFTLTTPTHDQKTICQLPWRSIFTTNYDDIVERSSKSGTYKFFSPQSSSLDIPRGLTPVYHLHGRAADLNEPSTLKGFVLSETDYLELNRHNSAIYGRLFSDIHAATDVIFIGYSLRDLEIASRLFSIKSIARKVSIITRSDDEDAAFTRLRLKKFGTVYGIGISGFSEQIALSLQGRLSEPKAAPTFLKKLSTGNTVREIQASDINDIVLTGQFNVVPYFSQLLLNEQEGAKSSELYCIERTSAINHVFDTHSSGRCNRFLIAADVGNGKSFYLKQLAVHAAKYHGYDVYEVDSQLQEIYKDIEIIVDSGRKSIFLIDGFARFRKVIEFTSSRLPPNCVLVVTDPETNDQYAGDRLFAEFNQRAEVVNINKLTLDEIQAWDALLERWGLWGDLIQLSPSERVRFIQKDCSSENRSIILSLFNTSAIANKIDALVRSFIANNEDYEQGLIAILIRALCHQHVEWSHVVAWLNLNELEIERRINQSGFRSLTEGARRWHEVTSPELAGFILNKYDFEAEKIVESYCRIAAMTASLSRDERNGWDSHENLKELMRYRFLTRLFAKNANQESYIDSVYQRLSKNEIIRAKELFWLQWGMARLDLGDTDRAQSYLTNAAGLAEKYKKDHSLIQINDQFARLYYKKAAKKGGKVNEAEVLRAIEITESAIRRTSEVLVHPMRSAMLINEFLEEKADELSSEITGRLMSLVREMISLLGERELDRVKKGENRQINASLKNSLLILQNT
ncbi:hypothetical protein D1114_10160 [Cereibacter sphaeroides]|uniref:SIR2-like domain-containing protein n=1 Tax=Cereibacter sphaeroides TaxID=1063 RepID=A0AAX1ULM5_CERSP|nr:SIR2 family protein [Cereibacter sphaeroides]RHZ95164.1 hypothetical protein D1114_10160 [Cereibacter sphaeroides]